MKNNKRKKNLIEKLLDEVIFVINSFINNLFELKGIELLKYIFEILIIILIVVLASIPFGLLETIGLTLINFIFPFSNNFISIWAIIIDAFYAVTAVCLFVVIYHHEFYRKYHLPVNKKNKYEQVYSELYKGLIILIAIPLFLLSLFTFISFIIFIIINLNHIDYYSITIMLLSFNALLFLAIKMVIDYLKDKRMSNNVIRMITISSIVVLVLGIVLLVIEFSNTKYYDTSVPNLDYSIHNETLETYINEELTIECDNCYEAYDIIYDNKLDNKVIVEVNYYDEYANVDISKSSNKLTIKSREHSLFNSIMTDTIKNNLQNKELYNYSLLFKMNLVIYVNEKDASKLDINVK